jgi:hypothetical protein
MSKRPQLRRRTVLKGIGTVLGLPLLEAMVPSSGFAAGSAAGPRRMAFVFVPNGVIVPAWEPTGEGSDWKLSPTLESLAKVKDKLCVCHGLAQGNADAKGDGPGDHARSSAAFLTGAHPVKTGGVDIRVGQSVDQVAAEKIGAQTKLPSIELGTEGGRNGGQCDSGYSCAYSNNISWKTASTPMAKEINPRLVFERLFGSADDRDAAKGRQKRDEYRKSILDMVNDDAAKLKQQLGQTDRRKIDEYFSSVREIEQRIERARQDDSKRQIPELKLPTGVPKQLDEHITLMFDLMTLAFQTDTTRVATFMMANEGSNRSYPMVGVNDGHHHLSHHQNKQDWIESLKKIDKFLIGHFARFLEKLDGIREGNGTLLDQSMIVYGSAIADGNRHSHHDLPILLAGRGGGSIQSGRRLSYPRHTPLNNLFLSLLDRMDSGVEQLGDSTGRLKGLDG